MTPEKRNIFRFFITLIMDVQSDEEVGLVVNMAQVYTAKNELTCNKLPQSERRFEGLPVGAIPAGLGLRLDEISSEDQSKE